MANINARVSHLHKTEAEWNNLKDFIPNAAELIIYDADETNPQRFKIGDGVSRLIDIPFYSASINVIDGGEISSYTSIYPEEPGEDIDE